MSKILINEIDDECRIAIIKDGALEELTVELKSDGQLRGNIYRGIVTQVQRSLQAAFVNFGDQRNGFLSIDELNFRLYPSFSEENSSRRIENFLKEGMEVLVQITRDPSEFKGAALTTFLSLPGRYMVLMPYSKGDGGVSKKVTEEEERERLKIFLTGLDTGEHSMIVRTAGVGKNLKELKADYDSLLSLWESIEKKSRASNEPDLLLEEENPVIRIFRDYFKSDVKEVWVDNPDTFQTVFQFLKKHEPRKQKILKIYTEKKSIFNYFEIEKQIEMLSGSRVSLPSGGSLVIDQTEALVSVDVNSGRSTRGNNNSDMALHTNLEAANEVARQLRLRNLGGLIVIDFIDMENRNHNKKVHNTVVKMMAADKAQHTIGEISQFGLLEMSRQRISRGYASSIQVPCAHCQGTGRNLSENLQVNSVIRRFRDLASRDGAKEISIDLPISMTNLLLNEKREYLIDLENEFDVKILVRSNPLVNSFNDNLFKVSYIEKEEVARDLNYTAKQPEKLSSSDLPKKLRSRPSSKKFEEKNSLMTSEENNAKEEKTSSKEENREKKEGAEEKSSGPKREFKRRNASEEVHYPLLSHFTFEDTHEEDDEEILAIRDRFLAALKGKPGNDYLKINDEKFLHLRGNLTEFSESKKKTATKKSSESTKKIAGTDTKKIENKNKKTATKKKTESANADKKIMSNKSAEKPKKTTTKKASVQKKTVASVKKKTPEA